MKTCDECKHANWKRTAAGRLHPSKDGVCTYKYTVPALPACMYWLSSVTPCGGHIKRGEENKDHCPYWARGEA